MISEWSKRCNKERAEDGESLADVLRVGTSLRPDAPAIVFEERTITYRELDSRSNRVANVLLSLGVKPGDRVAIHVDNRPEFIECYQGVMRVGATLVPTNVMYTAEEMEHILKDSGARVLFVRADMAPKIAPLRERLPELEHVFRIAVEGAEGDLEARLREASDVRPSVPVDRNAIAFIQYTSGTTGKPKGAMVTHANVLAVIDNMMDVPGSLESRDTDVLLLVLPLFHAYALNLAMNRAFLGAIPFVLVSRFDAEKITALFEKHRVTMFYGAPPMYFAFVNAQGLERYDVSSLRMAFSGAAPLPVVILERFKTWTGVEISEGYGLSETAPTLCSNAAGAKNKPGTVGPAIPGVRIRLVNDRDEDVPAGEVGEIIAQGPNVFRGYWRREAETAEAMRGGWFHTGDLAKIDEDGYYTIVDRKKDMILVSGYNVYPIEVENVLLRHPKILDAAVIGVPDEYQGESVKAVLVLRPGEKVETKEIAEYCRSLLAAYKVPRHVEVRDSLPKSATGKVLKREIRAGQ